MLKIAKTFLVDTDMTRATLKTSTKLLLVKLEQGGTMNYLTRCAQIIGLVIVFSGLVGCGASTVAPGAEVAASTPTSTLVAASPTPQPPTATPTSVPPTATFTPTPAPP